MISTLLYITVKERLTKTAPVGRASDIPSSNPLSASLVGLSIRKRPSAGALVRTSTLRDPGLLAAEQQTQDSERRQGNAAHEA